MVEYEVGEKFFYYGNHTSLHGNEGIVLAVLESSWGGQEYRCQVNTHREELYLVSYKMEKVRKTPDWEV